MGAEWLTEEVRGGKGNGSSSQQARRLRGGAARAKELRRHPCWGQRQGNATDSRPPDKLGSETGPDPECDSWQEFWARNVLRSWQESEGASSDSFGVACPLPAHHCHSLLESPVLVQISL